MPGRFIELAVRARRLVTPIARTPRTASGVRPTGRRQLGGELTQFSFRLAFVIDLAYIGLGALGGAAVGRGLAPSAPVTGQQPPGACAAPTDQRLH
jgi:hypothetical protein